MGIVTVAVIVVHVDLVEKKSFKNNLVKFLHYTKHDSIYK